MLEPQLTVGSRVRLRYTLRLASGRLVEQTPEGEVMELTLGSGDLLPMLEQRLMYLKAGESGHFEIPPEETREALGAGPLQVLPRGAFPEGMDIRPGTVIGFSLPNGEQVPGRVDSVEGDKVSVDFTHPLAGHALVFEVEIVDVKPGP